MDHIKITPELLDIIESNLSFVAPKAPTVLAMVEEIRRLRAAIQFARDKCVSRTAGCSDAPFAYMWQKNWDQFVTMATDSQERDAKPEGERNLFTGMEEP